MLEEDEDIIEEYGAAYKRDKCESGEIWNEATKKCVPDEDASGITMEENLNLEEMIRSILAEEVPIQETTFKPEDCPEGDTQCVEARTKRQKEVAAAKEKRREPYKKLAKQYCEDYPPHKKPPGCLPKGSRWDDEAQTAFEDRVVDKPPKKVNEHKQLNNKVKLLEEKLNKYQEVFPQLKEKLEESNLQNARLHYQNRVLNSASLNERQKDRLVETISKANTVEEAKIIYETLQSAVGASAIKRRPQSLNEVVTKSSSAFMPRKEEERVDPLAARMKALAGITDK